MDALTLRVVARHQRGALTLPREFYLPKEIRDIEPENPKGTDLYVWRYEVQGRPYGIAFVGKQRKPIWHHRFPSESNREKKIDETIESRRRYVEQKLEVLKQRRDFQHGLVEGDILYSSWGYDQTNVDFYQVTEVRGKHVIVREIASQTVRSE